MSPTPPKAIFLDAVGTLFGVRGSVGEIYGLFARQFGVEAEDAAIDRAFYEVFSATPEAAFPGASREALPELEFDWWRGIAARTFKAVGAFGQFDAFDDFFDVAFEYFATADAWEIYPDTVPSLAAWQAQGIPLGIISNFDSRLYSVLDVLELTDYFETVTLSTEVGAAKPDRAVFEAALHRQGVAPADAWHIGDSQRADIEGARAVGMQAIHIERT
ncbi:MAG: HAD-IA family hydrolase [Geitlerinemataceae cyanobacterium]